MAGRGGRKAGSSNYSEEERVLLLNLLEGLDENGVPVDPPRPYALQDSAAAFELLAADYNEVATRLGKPVRDAKSLRNQYNKVRKSSQSARVATLAPLIARARAVRSRADEAARSGGGAVAAAAAAAAAERAALLPPQTLISVLQPGTVVSAGALGAPGSGPALPAGTAGAAGGAVPQPSTAAPGAVASVMSPNGSAAAAAAAAVAAAASSASSSVTVPSAAGVPVPVAAGKTGVAGGGTTEVFVASTEAARARMDREQIHVLETRAESEHARARVAEFDAYFRHATAVLALLPEGDRGDLSRKLAQELRERRERMDREARQRTERFRRRREQMPPLPGDEPAGADSSSWDAAASSSSSSAAAAAAAAAEAGAAPAVAEAAPVAPSAVVESLSSPPSAGGGRAKRARNA